MRNPSDHPISQDDIFKVLIHLLSQVILDREWICRHDIHLVVHGDDYSEEQLESIYKVPMEMGILVTVPYTRGISTTDIIRRILDRRN